jgi:hypothetical protein
MQEQVPTQQKQPNQATWAQSKPHESTKDAQTILNQLKPILASLAQVLNQII